MVSTFSNFLSGSENPPNRELNLLFQLPSIGSSVLVGVREVEVVDLNVFSLNFGNSLSTGNRWFICGTGTQAELCLQHFQFFYFHKIT